MMKTTLIATLLLALTATTAYANNQESVNECIAAWGSKSPFKKGTKPNKTISTNVKVFGVGKKHVGDSTVTTKPSLVFLEPEINVLGKSTIYLANPNGWYCFRNNVTVAGKIQINAHCKAHIATSGGDGASVLAADESDKGVAVLGALRISRFDC
ncbi:MAG: hypothetical protein JNM52_09190, partial [Betaproteobacteria bacterium]|nr:hypothetical protein [Betaproteobacteria bacterium]